MGKTFSIFLGSKITADSDCSHEIKRCLLLGRKVMTNIESILKSKDITLLIRSDQIRSVAQWCPTLCDPMNRSMPGLPVHHQLPEFTQTNGPYNQSYGFSSSHVWMWELDHKEGWTPKNWCFQIVVLEKTLESLLIVKSSNQSSYRNSTSSSHWKDW